MNKKIQIVIDKANFMIEGFELTEIYEILTDYVTKDEAFLKRSDKYSFEKGLLVLGSVGTGKTQAFNVFREISRGSNNFFDVVSTRHIIRDYTVEGASVLSKYGRDSKRVIYFDDLGLEEVNAKMYGNNANVMSEILMDRYENFKRYGTKTFASSNLTATQFEEVYGARMRDRFREMFNIIKVEGNSFRK